MTGLVSGKGATIKSIVWADKLLLKLPPKPVGKSPTVKFATEPLSVVYLMSGKRFVVVTFVIESILIVVRAFAVRLVAKIFVKMELPSN